MSQNNKSSNPNNHKRKSIRLKGYDYSRAGLYFVSICTQNRECLFGKINDDEMILNDVGQMIEKWYYELENKFSDIKCHEMVVMPNHFHCIIEITNHDDDDDDDVGATLVVAQNENTPNVVARNENTPNVVAQNTATNRHNRATTRVAPTLGNIIGAFKSITTNEYIRGVKNKHWQPFDKKLWQRNYYEHIIRNENTYEHISKYIMENPLKWNDDKFNLNHNIKNI